MGNYYDDNIENQGILYDQKPFLKLKLKAIGDFFKRMFNFIRSQ